MRIVIQKFGGSSLHTEEARLEASRHVKKMVDRGYKSVIVVSAMGRLHAPYATDTLLSLIQKEHFPSREKDLLMSVGEIISAVVLMESLKKIGITSTVLTGSQAGILTTSEYGNARIKTIQTSRIEHELITSDTVIVTGFQGSCGDGEITTLGRGGSDTTAAALGVVLNAERVDVFTDVIGIMTADPKLVEDARALSHISFNEICNLAHQGAKVIHPRAVELLMDANIPFRVRSTFSEDEGTFVSNFSMNDQEEYAVVDRVVTGIAHVSGLTQISIYSLNDDLQFQSNVFKALADAKISIDFINMSLRSIVITVPNEKVELAKRSLEGSQYLIQCEGNCAKVSIVGAGMKGVPGVTHTIVQNLVDREISILQSSDSHSTIWVLIKEHDLKVAVNCLHEAFNLDQISTNNLIQEEPHDTLR